MRLQILNKKKNISNLFSTKEISSWTFLRINLVHASIVRSTNERRKEETSSCEFHSRFPTTIPLSTARKNRFHCACHYARCKLLRRGWNRWMFIPETRTKFKWWRNFSLSEVRFVDLSPGTRSHSSLPRFAVLSPPSRNVPRSVIDYRLSVKLLLSLWPIVIPRANSSEDRSPPNRWLVMSPPHNSNGISTK